MPQCPNCLLDLSVYSSAERNAAAACPNCGTVLGARAVDHEPSATFNASSADEATLSVAPVGPGATYVLFERFWKMLRDIILRPAQFFSTHASQIVSKDGLSSALAFAVIVQWIGSFFNFIWSSTIGALFQQRMGDLFQIANDVMETGPAVTEGLEQIRSRAIEFLFGAGAIVLAPFMTLIKLSVIALFVHAAVRFFIKETDKRPQSYTATLKILSYASAPWILCIIPGFGMLLAWALSFSAATIGIREVYRTKTARAALAVAFPELLLLSLLFFVAVIALFLAFNVLRLVF